MIWLYNNDKPKWALVCAHEGSEKAAADAAKYFFNYSDMYRPPIFFEADMVAGDDFVFAKDGSEITQILNPDPDKLARLTKSGFEIITCSLQMVD